MRVTSLCEKCPNTEFFCFAFSRIQTEYGDLRSPNTGKYRPEKTPYLDTFHAMNVIRYIK